MSNPAEDQSFDSTTDPCDLCGEENVGVGVPVILAIPGMFYPSREYDVPVFIPDPDVEIKVLKFPNDTIGLVTNEAAKKVHAECYTDLVDEIAYQVVEDASDDDDYDEGDEPG